MSLEKNNIDVIKKQLNNVLTPNFLNNLAKETQFSIVKNNLTNGIK